MRDSTTRLLRLTTAGLFFMAFACRNHNGKLPDVKFTPLPKQTPVHLDPSTVETFVDWVATMPSTQVNDVKEQIAAVKSDPKVVDAVASHLSFRNLGSYGRQLIYLSVLGELRNERALGPLQEYLNSRECPVFEEITAFPRQPGLPHTSKFDACAGLKSAAANMIAYLNTPAALNVVLQTIQEHPSRFVRLSAMNAYLFNNGDSPEAIAAARQRARPEEAKFVGMPRLSADGDRNAFAERLTRFYADHPEERAPELSRAARRPGAGHPPRMSVRPSGGPRGEGK